MKKLHTSNTHAGIAAVLICLLISAFAPLPGGFGYTIHVNGKLTGEYYLTSKHQTPVVALSEADMKGILSVYFNECGQIGETRKLSVRSTDQTILKEWIFANSTARHDPMEIVLKDVSGLLASGRVAVYYTSERVTKPQILTYLSTTTSAKKETSR